MLICSFTPGPGNILALNTTSTYGWKRSRTLILGICLGYAIVQTIGSIACLTWAFLGAKLQRIYLRYFKPANVVLGLFLLYCALTIVKG